MYRFNFCFPLVTAQRPPLHRAGLFVPLFKNNRGAPPPHPCTGRWLLRCRLSSQRSQVRGFAAISASRKTPSAVLNQQKARGYNPSRHPQNWEPHGMFSSGSSWDIRSQRNIPAVGRAQKRAASVIRGKSQNWLWILKSVSAFFVFIGMEENVVLNYQRNGRRIQAAEKELRADFSFRFFSKHGCCGSFGVASTQFC